MKKPYAVRKVEKILRELDAYRNSLAYLRAIDGAEGLPLRKAEIMKKRIRYLTHTLDAVEHALGFLDPIERTVIEGLYRTPDGTFDDVCEACALEKSSVYRYRARALAKLAAALFGE